MSTRRKLPCPKKGLFIVRFPESECFHAYIDGEHDNFRCGFDYRLVKESMQKDYPRRKINFIHFL